MIKPSSVRASRTLGRGSGRGGDWDLIVVDGHGRVPSGKQVPECAVEGPGAGLQEQMGALFGPLHLLLLGEALADHKVDRGLHERGRDRLAAAVTRAVVRDRGGVVLDVGG